MKVEKKSKEKLLKNKKMNLKGFMNLLHVESSSEDVEEIYWLWEWESYHIKNKFLIFFIRSQR